MPYNLAHTPKAEAEFLALPEPVRRRVNRWYSLLREDPRRSPTKKLEGHHEMRRVHAGKDYVVVYTINETELLVLVVRVAHRKDVYRRL